MIRLSVLVALFAGLTACDEQDLPPPDVAASAWRLGRPVPRQVRDAGVTTYVQQVIVAGGVDAAGQVSTEVDAYDVSGDTWRTLAPLPAAWTDPNLAAVGDTMYVLGGLDGAGQAHAEGARFDAVGQHWVSVSSMDPADARAGAGVVATTGHVFVLGGRSATAPLASCLEYDLVTDSWLHLPDLPEPRAYPAVMRQTDGALVVAGGFASVDRSAPRAEIWVLPPAGSANRVWQARAPLRATNDPDVRGDCAYATVLSNLTCAGGASSAGASRAVDIYDPYLDERVVGEPMPVARVETQGTAQANRLFVPGGAETVDGPPTDTMLIYDPLSMEAR
ncbi:MAG TPA: kelch repeat-containing protein [Kofleriaceae bacterium]